ncbi:hypothetical protein AA313_de0208295 [Arthrobotrys entomopaga]|nr:hypothetical protein AA313_de0208295 [Arthrobotrys entomopaga]
MLVEADLDEDYTIESYLDRIDVENNENLDRSLLFKQIVAVQNFQLSRIESFQDGSSSTRTDCITEVDITMETDLLVDDDNTDQNDGCPNARLRPGLWDGAYDIKPPHSSLSLPTRIAHFTRELGIRRCQNPQCVKNKEQAEKIVPQCKWTKLREWTVSWGACLRSFTVPQMATLNFLHMAVAASEMTHILLEYEINSTYYGPNTIKGTPEDEFDVFGMFELIYWISITVPRTFRVCLEVDWFPKQIPAEAADVAIQRALELAKGLKICSYRLWKIGDMAERKYIDIPAFMEAAIQYPALQNQGHDDCTLGFCKFNKLDSTGMAQLHKCRENDCRDFLQFDPKLLNKSVKEGGRTVWTTVAPYEVSQKDKYVAISHVWSDGTGIGLQPVGEVNKCLFEYFANLVEKLGYKAIWWDSISIPTDREARRIAINNMHDNYSNAAATILHESYLANFEWAEDGSPCLALLLSSWLTRGWTALEHLKSKNLYVIFKGKDGEPVLKNVARDVLAQKHHRSSGAHWIATGILKRLSYFDEESASSLLAIIKSRTTSWETDRITIAALLSGLEEIPRNVIESDFTKKILLRMPYLHSSAFFHDKPTITQSGGWSWCPHNLYDMPAVSQGNLIVDIHDSMFDPPHLIDSDGFATGYWWFRDISYQEITDNSILTLSKDPTVEMNVRRALRRWEYCILLCEHNRGGPGNALLVIPLDGTSASHDETPVPCKYIGVVRIISEKSTGGGDIRLKRATFRIGEKPDDGVEIQSSEMFRRVISALWLEERGHIGYLNLSDCSPLWVGEHIPGRIFGMRPNWDESKIDWYQFSLSESRPRVELSNGRRIYYCDVNVTLLPQAVFTVGVEEDKTLKKEDSNLVGRAMNDSSLVLKEYPSLLLSQLSPSLLKPNVESPLQGIWAIYSPAKGHDIIALTQSTASQLVAKRITTKPNMAQATVLFLVDDINATHEYIREGDPWSNSKSVTGTVFSSQAGMFCTQFSV